jgi:hypothetical protein
VKAFRATVAISNYHFHFPATLSSQKHSKEINTVDFYFLPGCFLTGWLGKKTMMKN